MFRSPFPDVDIPEVSLHEAMLTSMEQFSYRVALVDATTGQEYTFRQVIDYARNGASGLARRGVRQGDMVAFFVPNVPEFPIMLLATLSAGATITTINPVYTHYELTHHFQDSGTSWVFTTKELLPKVKQAMVSYKGVKSIITVEHAEGCVYFNDLASDDGSHFPKDLKVNPREDLAIIPYSSGTTGLPKGVMTTHYNYVAQLAQLSSVDVAGPPMEDAPQGVVMAVLPFFHVYGLVIFNMMALCGGAKIIILRRFQPHTFLGAIQKYKVTSLPVVPPIIIFMAKSELVKQYDISSVETVSSGAAPIDMDTLVTVKKRLGIEQLGNGYGMTETTCSCTVTGISNPIKDGSLGFLRPNMEGKFVDPTTGKVCGPNERGELWMRGPNIMKGYYKKPEATRQTLDSEGFLHTGDIGYRDEDGYLYVVDRIKELIKYKGFQVAPAELEAVILSHPGVADVGVVGIKDLDAGELPRAYVVRKDGKHVTKDELDAFVHERVAPFKRLRGGIVFVSEIPRNPTGKIMRRNLVEMFGHQSKL